MLNQYVDAASLRILSPQVAGALSVVPLVRPGSTPPAYHTLGHALAHNLAEVTEVSDGGSVPQLLFRNLGDLPVILLDGEELVGAKQNRVLNLTILAPPMSDIRIPVSCIERGRWAWQSRHFKDVNRTLYADARRQKMRQVNASMRSSGDHRSDQTAIWSAIQEKSARFGVRSETGAASDIYEQQVRELDRLVAQIQPYPDQVGAAFLVGKRLVGIELFGSAKVLEALLPKLVRSYGLDALDCHKDGAASHTTQDLAPFLSALESAVGFTKPALGLGQDIRIDTPAVLAGGLVHAGQLVHLTAFARDRAPTISA